MYSLARVILLVVLAIGIARLIVAASRQPYFPSDLPVARAVQSFVPMPVGMATWITASADRPWYFVLLSFTERCSDPIFFGLLLFGIWLSPHPKGYAFPSVFGLVYAATFDYIGLLAAVRLDGAPAFLILILAAVLLILGACARIVLGVH
jgi:hypothetical protein